MALLSIGKLTFEAFAPFVEIQEKPMMKYAWIQVKLSLLPEAEQTQLHFIPQRLLEEPAF